MLTPQTSEKTRRARKAALATGSSNLTHTAMLFWKMPFKENSTSPSPFFLLFPDSLESDSRRFQRPFGCLSVAAWAMLIQHYEGADWLWQHRQDEIILPAVQMPHETNKQTKKSNLEKRLLFKDNCVASVHERVHVRVCVTDGSPFLSPLFLLYWE